MSIDNLNGITPKLQQLADEGVIPGEWHSSLSLLSFFAFPRAIE